MTAEAAQILQDTLRYAKKRGYGLDIWLLPGDRATLVVQRPISHESTPVASGKHDEMIGFVEFWRDLIVEKRVDFQSAPIRVTPGCFLRDRRATRNKPDPLDRKAERIWRRYEMPEYYEERSA